MNRGLPLFGAITLLLMVTGPAQADRYDFNLAAFVEAEGGVNRVGFKQLSRDVGLAFQPRFTGPASTRGSTGFDVGYALTLTDIDQNASQWTESVRDAGNMLLLSQISVHKGLPYSFGLSATLGHLHESALWGIDLGIKWAFVEGFEYFPDLALHVQVGRVMGNRDMSLLRTGGDLQISKAFGLGGMIRLTPYASYSFALMLAKSHVLGVFQEWDVEPSTQILTDQILLEHRGTAGIRITYAMIDAGFEVALGQVQTYAFRFGLTF